jgi:hypothetical protein
VFVVEPTDKNDKENPRIVIVKGLAGIAIMREKDG